MWFGGSFLTHLTLTSGRISSLWLIFSLPLSNGQVERCFSRLKIVKTNRRSCLGKDRLENLIRIQLEGPPLQHWDASRAVELWWTDKSRRINRSAGGSRASTSGNQAAASGGDNFAWDLSDWERTRVSFRRRWW